MSRHVHLSSTALLLALLCTAVPPALADNSKDRPANLQPLLAVPPPPPEMQAFDESFEPQVTIRRQERETREEYRHNGKLYMVKVTPQGSAPYYLIDRTGDGSFVRSESTNPPLTPPMWVIGTF